LKIYSLANLQRHGKSNPESIVTWFERPASRREQDQESGMSSDSPKLSLTGSIKTGPCRRQGQTAPLQQTIEFKGEKSPISTGSMMVKHRVDDGGHGTESTESLNDPSIVEYVALFRANRSTQSEISTITDIRDTEMNVEKFFPQKLLSLIP
jgi:hypothetical protein